MALADLTIADIVGDIQTEGFDFSGGEEGSESKPKYRIRKGEYLATITQVRPKEAPDGRRSATLITRLENDEEKFRGMVFPEISWEFRENFKGKLDLKSRLFGQLVAALGVPQGTALPIFLEGIQDESVRVYVSEFFRVEYKDLLEDDKPDSDSGYKVMVFINDDDDDKAEAYLDAGYQSQGMVLSIAPLG